MNSVKRDLALTPSPLVGEGWGEGSLRAPARAMNCAPTSLLRLCQLVSPALPIGSYHFSQGLEHAVHAEWIRNEQDAGDWILGISHNAIGTLDIPVLLRMHNSWTNGDAPSVNRWSQYLIASRETSELRAEERHMGKALAKVLIELDIPAHEWITRNEASYAAMFTLAATLWSIDRTSTAQAYLWAWSENQVLAALKLMSIGQSAGQRILNRIIPAIPHIVANAAEINDEDVGIATPLHGMASAWHETQYSRLFRS